MKKIILVLISIFFIFIFLKAAISDVFLNKAKKAYKLTPVADKIKNKKEKPVISIISPLSGEEVSGTLLIKGQANDNYEIIKIEIKINEKEWISLYNGNEIKSKEFEYCCDTTKYNNGSLNIKAAAYDQTKNRSETEINIIINNTSTKIIQQPENLKIINEKLYLNGSEYYIKSIGLEPFMPGEYPLVYPVKSNYTYALSNIKELNANTVYLLTGDPANLQEAFFQRAKAEGIFIILGLWFSGEADDYQGHSGDFQNSYFKNHVKNLIRQFINKYHNINGTDYSSQILYVILGNEFSSATISSTAASHPNITNYNGKYVSVSGINPTECFMAEMMDYFKTYEAENYNEIHYISHHTWPVVSPWQMKNNFLDIISYNLYSYWPPFVSGHSGGSSTGTPYQGALEELASYYTNKPFVVSEFGISVAASNVTVGTNLTGQSNEMAARWQDITTANRYIAGGCIHELFDQWWKDDGVFPHPSGPDQDEHDPTDREEYFGLINVEGPVAAPTYTNRPAFYGVMELFK